MASSAPSSGGGSASPRAGVASRLAGATGLERMIAGVVEETIVRTVESDAVVQAIERIVTDGRLQAAIERSIDPEMVEVAVRRAIESQVSDQIWEEILASDKAQMLVERVAEAPEVRAAIAQQGFGLIFDIGRQLSRITEALDDVVERGAHALTRRDDHERETNQAGLITRLAAFAVDGALLFGFLSIASGVLASIFQSVFGGDPGGLSGVTIACLIVAALLFAGGTFVAFWTLIGQTPGMRFFGIRLQCDGSNEISLRRSLRRALAIPFAVLPAALGFLAILISPRRRGWHDVFAGTEVVYDEASAPWSLEPREWVQLPGEEAGGQPGGPPRAKRAAAGPR